MRSWSGHLIIGTGQEILDYQEKFDELHQALYRWELWAAADLIGGGRSDDSFIDFRAGLIAQGRDWYDKAAASPDSLADHSAVSGYRPSPLGQPAVLRGGQLRRLLCVPAANRR